jgi:hypothetical protein
VSEEVRTVVGDSAPADAELMARHLVEDLLIEADAVRANDETLAATALAGPRLEDAQRRISEGAEPAAHTFDTMTVVMVRDPDDPQSIPRFGIRATGDRADGGAGSPFDRVFVLQEVDEVWLLTDELAPART